MIKHLFHLCIFTAAFLIIPSHVFAQCTSAIPGLPAGSNIPCNNNIPGPVTPVGTYDPNDAASPNANKNTSDFCDADFMNQIHARAFLETSREIMTAQLLVPKPDSVLEYSCFDQRVRDIARIAGPDIFSNSNAWVGSAGGVYGTIANPGAADITLGVFMGTGRYETVLNNVVMASLNNFVNTNNFTHTFLGGTQSTADDTIAANIAGAGSTCRHMRNVWQLAKCEDVMPPMFFTTFTGIGSSTNIITDDIRDVALTGLPACGTNLLVPELLQIANNDGGVYAYKEDIVPYLDYMTTTPSGTCADPIRTGLQVTQEEFNYPVGAPPTLLNRQIFEDHVCPNPGCFYRHSSTSCEQAP